MKTFLSITMSLSICFCFAQQRTIKGEVLTTSFGSFGSMNSGTTEKSGRQASGNMQYKQTTIKTKDGALPRW